MVCGPHLLCKPQSQSVNVNTSRPRENPSPFLGHARGTIHTFTKQKFDLVTNHKLVVIYGPVSNPVPAIIVG